MTRPADKPFLTTKEAAFYLCLSEHTLYTWKRLNRGPIKPLKVKGRIYWPTFEVKRHCPKSSEIFKS